MKSTSLRWSPTPDQFGKHPFWLTLLATIVSTLFLSGCNSATSSDGKEFLGNWENMRVEQLTMTISQTGDQFVIRRREIGGDHTYLGVVKNGLLQITDGSGVFYTYHKDSDTITIPGLQNELEYRRRQ